MEIEGSRVDLANRIVELEAQCEWLKEDKIKLKEQVMKAKGEEERMKGKYMKGKGEYLEMKEKFGLEKIKWREEDEKIWGKYWQLEEANRMLQFDVKENASSINGGDEASVKLRATEAEVERLKSSLEERDGRITKLLEKIGALDKQCNTLETDFKAKMVMEAKKTKLEEEKNLELIRKLQVLEREKEQMVAEASKLRKEKSDEAERSYSAKKALEAEIKRLKKALEWVEKAMQDGVSNLKREKSEEVSLKKIVALEKENNEMKAKLSRANMEKDAEIKRILNEKITLKEEGQKMITERDEAIKILYQENQTLEAQNKQLEMEKIRLVLKREEDVDSAHQSHSVSNVVGFLATTPAQNIQGIIKIEEQTTLASS